MLCFLPKNHVFGHFFPLKNRPNTHQEISSCPAQEDFWFPGGPGPPLLGLEESLAFPGLEAGPQGDGSSALCYISLAGRQGRGLVCVAGAVGGAGFPVALPCLPCPPQRRAAASGQPRHEPPPGPGRPRGRAGGDAGRLAARRGRGGAAGCASAQTRRGEGGGHPCLW